MKKSLKILIMCVMCVILLSGCGKDDRKGRTVYVNGTITSNEKIDGTDQYKNIVTLEDGEVWEWKSSKQLVQLDREQHINKGDPNDAPNVVVIVIPPKEK